MVMNQNKSLLNNAGFTLVELMVVVAIIGILASIAIPNYSRFQSKTRQSEAKIALSAIYSAETSFAVEAGTYTECLKATGYSPEIGVTRYYAIGLNSAYELNAKYNGTSYSSGIKGGPSVACKSPDGEDATALTEFIHYWNAINHARNSAGHATFTQIPSLTQMTQNKFQVGAAGQINTSSKTNLYDKWTISEKKNLENIHQSL